jgi:hypothetical protein
MSACIVAKGRRFLTARAHSVEDPTARTRNCRKSVKLSSSPDAGFMSVPLYNVGMLKQFDSLSKLTRRTTFQWLN